MAWKSKGHWIVKENPISIVYITPRGEVPIINCPLINPLKALEICFFLKFTQEDELYF